MALVGNLPGDGVSGRAARSCRRAALLLLVARLKELSDEALSLFLTDPEALSPICEKYGPPRMLYDLRSFLSTEQVFRAAQTFRAVEQIDPCNAAEQIREARMTGWQTPDCDQC
jgi:hypothetical protein